MAVKPLPHHLITLRRLERDFRYVLTNHACHVGLMFYSKEDKENTERTEKLNDIFGYAPKSRYGIEYGDSQMDEIPIEDNPMWRTIKSAYRYAIELDPNSQITEKDLQKLHFYFNWSVNLDFDNSCLLLAEVASARWKLENDLKSSFTLRELSFLANMTEAAIRNCIALLQLTAIDGSRPTMVERQEAISWLQGRRLFRQRKEREVTE